MLKRYKWIYADVGPMLGVKSNSNLFDPRLDNGYSIYIISMLGISGISIYVK